ARRRRGRDPSPLRGTQPRVDAEPVARGHRPCRRARPAPLRLPRPARPARRGGRAPGAALRAGAGPPLRAGRPARRAGRARADDRETIAELGTVLDAAGYTAASVERALTADGERVLRAADTLPLQLRLLPPGERLSTLILLFYLAAEVTTGDAAAALAPIAL